MVSPMVRFVALVVAIVSLLLVNLVMALVSLLLLLPLDHPHYG